MTPSDDLVRRLRNNADSGDSDIGSSADMHEAADRIEQLEAKERVLFDIHEALGIKWGDDPYAKIAQLAARAEPQPVAWEPSLKWQEDAISMLQAVQIMDWSADPATGHPRHVAECTAADLLDCVLKELPPLCAAPPACALGGEP